MSLPCWKGAMGCHQEGWKLLQFQGFSIDAICWPPNPMVLWGWRWHTQNFTLPLCTCACNVKKKERKKVASKAVKHNLLIPLFCSMDSGAECLLVSNQEWVNGWRGTAACIDCAKQSMSVNCHATLLTQSDTRRNVQRPAWEQQSYSLYPEEQLTYRAICAKRQE